MLTVGMRKEPSSASGLTDDIDGEPPRAQNTLVCTGTWHLTLIPKPRRTAAVRAPTISWLITLREMAQRSSGFP